MILSNFKIVASILISFQFYVSSLNDYLSIVDWDFERTTLDWVTRVLITSDIVAILFPAHFTEKEMEK